MHFSIPSLLCISSLSLLASTGLPASIPTRSLATDITNIEAIVEIKQLYSAYSLLLDDKNYAALSYIFTDDIVFNNPTLNFSTLPVVEEFFRAEYLNKTTLHTLENVFVFDISANKARVTSDGIVNYFSPGFGRKNVTDETATTYTRMNSTVVKENGSWKIAVQTSMPRIRIENLS